MSEEESKGDSRWPLGTLSNKVWDPVKPLEVTAFLLPLEGTGKSRSDPGSYLHCFFVISFQTSFELFFFSWTGSRNWLESEWIRVKNWTGSRVRLGPI